MFDQNSLNYLRHFDLSYNYELTRIGFFALTNFVSIASFHACNLNEFPRQFFFTIELITILNLNKNRLYSIKFVDFINIARIHNLYMSDNLISFIEDNVFKKVKELQVLDLSINNITNLFNFTLTGLFSLHTLNLSSNSIAYLQNGVFDDLARVITIDLSSNLIKSIEESTFIATRLMEKVYFHRNPLQRLFIKGMFAECEELTYIFISPLVEFNYSIYKEIKDDWKAAFAKQVLDMRYYWPVHIVINSDSPIGAHHVNYSPEQCLLILLLLKDKFQFNLVDYEDAIDYVSQCADSVMTAYKQTAYKD
jgi:hypothetical protein